MSKSTGSRSRNKDRFEARFNSMKLAEKGQDEIYNVMLERLSKAIETGEVTMKDNSSTCMNRAEQAHVLLQKATISLMSKQRQKGGAALSSSSSGASQKGTTTLKCNRRQEAAAWAKANPTAGLPSSGFVSPREQALPRTPDHTRRSYDPEEEDDYDEKGSNGSSYSEDISDDEEDKEGVDISKTKHEINTTRKLLRGAASRLKQGGANVQDKGVNNTIYEQLMQELNLTDDKPKPRSVSRAEAAAGLRPSLEKGPDKQVSRRAFAADMLTADKTRDPHNLPGVVLKDNSKPSERRTHALDILKTLQTQKERQSQEQEQPQSSTRRKSASHFVAQSSPAPPPRSSSSRASAHLLSMSSPVPSLASSSQSHGSAGSASRGSGGGGGGGSSSSARNHHRRKTSGDVASSSTHRKRANSHENVKLDRFLVSSGK